MREKNIVYMPRKNKEHALFVFAILEKLNGSHGFKIEELDGLSESNLAQKLQKSSIFLSTGFPEGFALPPAEAMACGALVVGYHGNAAKEYMHSNLCSPVEYWDIPNMVKSLQAYIELLTCHPERAEFLSQKASASILDRYTQEQERCDWHAVMKKIMN
jgi:glycosyltransferase involved in cell wall biosynthesis